MFFFARVNQTCNSFQKRTKNHFYGNHFWSKCKSFSCVVNHLQLCCKSFWNTVNDFFTAKMCWKWFLVAVNHLLKNISMWKWVFKTGNHHFLKVRNHFYVNHFQSLLFQFRNHFLAPYFSFTKVVVRSLTASGNKFDGWQKSLLQTSLSLYKSGGKKFDG